MAEPKLPPGFDFTDPDLYAARVPQDEFAELRRTAPVWWNPQPPGTGGFDDEGFWAVTRHADIVEISRDSDTYSTWENTAIIRHAEGATRESIELQRFVMLNIDPPQHTKLRGIVSRGFTPRAIGSLREALTARAGRITSHGGSPAAPATSSGTWPPNCRCRRSRSSSACPRRTGARSSRGPTTWSATTTRTTPRTRRPRRPRSSATAWRWPRTGAGAPGTTSSPSSSTPRSTAAACPPTSSASS